MDPAAPIVRKIIHVDMDAFFASVEQRDDPSLRGRPVAVGGSRERGVVAAASYEARVFGVRSAMSSMAARRRCPDLLFVKPRFEVYRAVSMQVRAIFAAHSELVEPLSLDEAYLDVTESCGEPGSATAAAEAIRAGIWEETGLTASAGVSYNKFLAKIASDQNKPDGLCVITPRQGAAFVAGLPVARFHGVGPKTAERMRRLGIETGADLRARSLSFLEAEFGRAAGYFHRASRGVDDRPVRPDRVRKSIGAERTFMSDHRTPDALSAALEPVLDALLVRAEAARACGRTLTLKVKFDDFRQITRARSFAAPVRDRRDIAAGAQALLAELCPLPRPVRLLGVTLSALEEPGAPDRQLGLGL